MSAGPSYPSCPNLGVLVPCRDEAAVIARKLANLARLRWPDAPRAHRVVIVDDQSSDDTAVRARDALAAHPLPAGVRASVVRNDGRPGKASAIAAGLDALGGDVDVIVLTDADVVFEDDALRALADAFAREPGLGMACGSQRFVRDLCDDGRPLGADGREPVPAPGRYDRWTAEVRALESRGGRLFSVHGQLLGWRAGLGLRPTPGLAADDLDLMLAVRARGMPVRKLTDARFLEVKTPPGAVAEAQALRRARAYVQIVRRARWPRGRDLDAASRVQLLGYRVLPLAAPWSALAVLLGVLVLSAVLGGPNVLEVVAVLVVASLLSPAGRRLVRLLTVIARATLVESRAEIGDRWTMTRG
ncbi:MAG: glycosyltransferase [Planctomycetes bacterium]|nr:glycosyltransferase [Planctomycetota bacterium]